MPRQRKAKPASSNDVPIVQPNNTTGKKAMKPLVEISEEEQRRLINESGVLNKIPKPELDASGAEEYPEITFGEEVLNTVLYVVPFSFLLVMMDMCVLLNFGLAVHS